MTEICDGMDSYKKSPTRKKLNGVVFTLCLAAPSSEDLKTVGECGAF